MAISTIGTNGLTTPLPASNLGTPSAINLSNATALAKAALPTGTVLQVVNNFSASQISTTSNTYVSTGFSASITPSSASNKILILVSTMMYAATATSEPQIAVYRGGSNLGSFSDTYSNAGPVIAGASFMYVDSPATTSSTTYTLYFRQGNTGSGGTIYIGPNSTTYGIVLQEIAA